MGWTHDEFSDADHEGYTLGVLASGVIPTIRFEQSGVISELTFMEGDWWGVTRQERPGEDAAWMLPACVCGWRGERVPYTGYDPQAPEAGRDQWDAHMAELAGQLAPEGLDDAARAFFDALAAVDSEVLARPLASLGALRAVRTNLDYQIVRVVEAARRADESWTAIGRALGVTRQTAWERYRNVDAAAGRND